MQKNKILQSPLRIRFSDCDPMGHLYNATYIRYLLDARESQVEEAYGFNPIDHAFRTGRGWVVVQNQIAYLQAARMNEKVICQSFCRAFSPRTLDVECTMWDENKNVVKAVLWTRFVYMDTRTSAVVNHEEDMMALFESLWRKIEHDDFDSRVTWMRNHNKKKSATDR